jgi:aspartokinase
MRADAVHFEKERGVTEVSVMGGIAHATIILPQGNVSGGQLELLQRLAAANIPVFLIKLLPNGLSFALRESVVDSGNTLLTETGLSYTLRRNLSLITIIAGAMRDLSGVMASIYEALISENTRVHQTGDAHNAVHCLVSGEQADSAATALRKMFALQDSTIADGAATPESPAGVGPKVL